MRHYLACFVALVVPVLAFAQDVVVPVEAPGPFSKFIVSLLPHLLEIVSGLLLTVLFPMIYKWISAKKAAAVAGSKSTIFLGLADKAAHVANLVVADVDATMSAELAKRAADGVLDDADKKALRELALERAKRLLTPAGLLDIAKALGTPAAPAAPEAVDAFLVSHNEAALDAFNAPA